MIKTYWNLFFHASLSANKIIKMHKTNKNYTKFIIMVEAIKYLVYQIVFKKASPFQSELS